MINRHGFLYAPPMLGRSPFEAMNERNLLGQTPPAPPQTVVVQAPGGAAVAPQIQAESSGVPMVGVLIVVGAVLVGLEVGGVINIFGLDKLQGGTSKKEEKEETKKEEASEKKADAKKV
jgi:hypothetical protein